MSASRPRVALTHLIAALLLASTLIFGLSDVAAQPARAATTSPPATGPFKQITSTALDGASIDGPALAGWTTGQTRAAIAWTGTETAHPINVMITDTGARWLSKRTLSETSFARPAVTVTPDNVVAIAWSGNDSGHTLNVLYDVYGVRGPARKLTIWGDTSDMAPALAYDDGKLYLAWAGRNKGHSLNVMPITIGASGLSVGKKIILWDFKTNAAPSVSVSLGHTGLILAWSATGSQSIRYITSANGVNWPATATSLPEETAKQPQMATFVASNMPQAYLAWTGTDANHSLNVQYTTTYPSWPAGAKTTFRESVLGGPQMAYIGGPQALLLAWTTNDAARRLNVAVITPSSTCTAPPGVTPVSSQLVIYGNTTRKQVALTFDAGGTDGAQANKLLNILNSRGVRSTWFFQANWAQNERAIVRRVVASGAELGNHTIDHPNLTTPARSDEYICYELGMTEQIVREISGVSTRPYFRPPFGAYNTQVLNDAARIGFRTVYWSIDTIDWDPNTTATQIINRALNSPNLKNGAIILMHAGSLHEPEALDQVITGLQAKGYQLVPLSQLLA